MKIAEVAIRRPVFITCCVLVILVTGFISIFKLPVDLFPNVTLPYMNVTIVYSGAGPSEMENLVAKPLEDEIRTISGVKRVMSFCNESLAMVWAEFQLESDPLFVEQQMRDKVAIARTKMPKNIEEPLIQRYDVSDQPVVTFSIQSKQDPNELFELADKKIKPSLEQVEQVSHINILGSSKREIQVLLDRKKLENYELSISQVAQSLELGGENIPLGKHKDTQNQNKEWIYRSLGEYNTLQSIKAGIVKFLGNDIPVRIGDIAQVIDTFKDSTSYAFLNGQPTLIMQVYRQSGANTVAVADNVKKRIQNLNNILKKDNPGTSLVIIRDGAKTIRDNIQDVTESIIIGILLTVVVVFFFLGSFRSTFITSVALPNSLIGAFLLIGIANFSINTLTLLSLSLAVGLLVDDAIVVRENIFRHIEMGKPARKAALEGTAEVGLAVIATTCAIMSVFGPIAFIGGITGRFLREFGLTVCFIMLISLFDALTVGPMLSALFGSAKEKHKKTFLNVCWDCTVMSAVEKFEQFQIYLKEKYTQLSRWTVAHPGRILIGGIIIFIISLFTLPFIPKTFLPAPDMGETIVRFELSPGSSLEATRGVALEIDKKIRENKEVDFTSLIVGEENGDPTTASVYVKLVPQSKRKLNTTGLKNKLRKQLEEFNQYKIKITDFDVLFGGQRPFSMKLISGNYDLLERTAEKFLELMKQYPGFVEADTDYRPGKPEMTLIYDQSKTKLLGVSTEMAGAEVRAQIEGVTPAKFRENGEEWDIRVRMDESDRDLKRLFPQVLIPNLNNRLVNLSQVAQLIPKEGLSVIHRQNSQRAIELSAELGKGYGVSDLINWVQKMAVTKNVFPPEVHYVFEGQGEQSQEMFANMMLAVVLAILFIYLVLSSLYESFVTPFYLLIPLPLAVCGAFVALLIGGQSLNIYSMIACIMLLGIATKNSILLIDYTNQLVAKGKKFKDAIVEAGRTRLRPILMTSMTLIAGTLPVAIGLNEASKQRASMGWVIIGGIISSTLLTLLIVPASLSLFRRKK